MQIQRATVIACSCAVSGVLYFYILEYCFLVKLNREGVVVIDKLDVGGIATRFPAKARNICLLQKDQTGCGAHPGSHLMSTAAVFPWGTAAVA
jgi:hypothetical protein